MAQQRSIMSFFGAKSPPAAGSSDASETNKKDTALKKVLSSPQNKPTIVLDSPSKSKKSTQMVIEASPAKMMVAVSPKKKSKSKKALQSDSEDEIEVSKSKKAPKSKKVSESPKSCQSEERENNSSSVASSVSEKIIRKRKRNAVSSSSSSASEVEWGTESSASSEEGCNSSIEDSDKESVTSETSGKSSHGSLSTDYADLDKMEVENAKKAIEKKPVKGKAKLEPKKKPAAVKKAPSSASKKKTPAKTPKLDTKADKKATNESKKTPKIEAKIETATPVIAVNNQDEQVEEKKADVKAEPSVAPAKPGEYDPSQEKYDPVTSATWKAGEKTPFLCLARTLDYAEKTSSRLRTMETVANFFASVIRLSPSDLAATVYLCLGVIAPAHLGIETSVGEGALLKALTKATGRSMDNIKKDLQTRGDIGEVAETSRQVQPKLGFMLSKPASLTIAGVFAKLREIAAMHGASSQNQRVEAIAKLLTSCQPVEAKFLVRLLTGKLRVGLAEQSVLIALAHSAVYARCKTPKDRKAFAEDKAVLDKAAKALRLAFANCPDVERITKALEQAMVDESGDLMEPLYKLPERCPIVPGLPVKPMLAQPAKSMHEIVEKLGDCAKDELEALPGNEADKPGRILACEYKYDGERAEIHIFYPNGPEEKATVKIYSRNQEDHTVRFSEVANRIATEAVLPEARGKTLIIDSEIVAVDANGRHLPFQMLAARKRKEVNPEEEEAKEAKKKLQPKETKEKEPSVPAYQAIAFIFDCIMIDDKSLVSETLLERRRKIRECIKPIDGLVEWAVSFEIDMDKEEHEVEEKVGHWLEKSVQDGCEGLIVKTATSKYMVARRAPCWLKLKKDYIETEGSNTNGMGGDSVDLVVVAGYWGAGKRTGRLGAFLLASYDPFSDQYETVCKLGTGLSDELLDQLTEQLMPQARPQGAPAPTYVKRNPGLPEPNVWLEPNVVWEIRAADLSLSNVHTSGLGSIPGAPDRGVSLRFPRYVRARPDKKPEEATTSENMCRRYANQQQVQFAADGHSKNKAVDDDFY